MFKVTLCCLLLAVLVAVGEAGKKEKCEGGCNEKDLYGKRTICARSAKSNVCTRMYACQMRERNCALRELGLAPMRKTSSRRCRRIKSKLGSGRCAGRRRRSRRHRRSRRLSRRCSIRGCKHQKANSCWRSKSGRHRWISACSAKQRNCRNRKRPHRQLRRVSDWMCKSPKDKDLDQKL